MRWIALPGMITLLVLSGCTVCDDSHPCAEPGPADAGGGCPPGTPLPLDDGNPCTLDTCQAGAVAHTPILEDPICRQLFGIERARAAYLARAASIDMDGDGTAEWQLTWTSGMDLPSRETIDANRDGRPEVRWERALGVQRLSLDLNSDGVIEEIQEIEKLGAAPDRYRRLVLHDRNGDGRIDARTTFLLNVESDTVEVSEELDDDYDGTFTAQPPRTVPRLSAQDAQGPSFSACSAAEQVRLSDDFREAVTTGLGCLKQDRGIFLEALEANRLLLRSSCSTAAELCGHYDSVAKMSTGEIKIHLSGDYYRPACGGKGSAVIFHEIMHHIKGLHRVDSDDTNDPIKSCQEWCFHKKDICTEGAVFDQQRCECVCKPGLDSCPAKQNRGFVCKDTTSDDDYCGKECKPCPQNQVCFESACYCRDASQVPCGKDRQCVASDEEHCGASCQRCGKSEKCEMGRCVTCPGCTKCGAGQRCLCCKGVASCVGDKLPDSQTICCGGSACIGAGPLACVSCPGGEVCVGQPPNGLSPNRCCESGAGCPMGKMCCYTGGFICKDEGTGCAP